MRGFFVLAAALIAMPVISHAKPLPGELAKKDRALIFEPDSPWRLDVGKDRCTLARNFKSKDGRGLVAFEQFAPGPHFDLTIAGPDFSSSQNGAWTYLGMRSDKPVEVIDPLEFNLVDYGHAVTLASAQIGDQPPQSPDGRPLVSQGIDLQAAEMFERVVFQRSTRIVSFETGSMRAPFEALNACAIELLDYWEVEPEDHRQYMPPVMPQPRTYFARLNNDLLKAGKLTGSGTLVRLRARIESDGTVAHCAFETMPAVQSDIPDICADIAKMKFEPALGKDGESFASIFTLSVRLTPYGAWNAGADGSRWGGL
jgi:hypothetical protein